MEQAILFCLTFIVVYLAYYLLTVRKELNKENYKKNPEKYKKKKNLKKYQEDGKIPVEIQFLLLKYKLDFKKVSYRDVLYTLTFVSSLVISITVTVISFVSGLILQLLVGFALLIPLILLSFHFVGKFYQKKGKK